MMTIYACIYCNLILQFNQDKVVNYKYYLATICSFNKNSRMIKSSSESLLIFKKNKVWSSAGSCMDLLPSISQVKLLLMSWLYA